MLANVNAFYFWGGVGKFNRVSNFLGISVQGGKVHEVNPM